MRFSYDHNLIRKIERHPRVLDVLPISPTWEIGRYKLIMPDGREAVFRFSEKEVTAEGKNPELLKECFGEYLMERG